MDERLPVVRIEHHMAHRPLAGHVGHSPVVPDPVPWPPLIFGEGLAGGPHEPAVAGHHDPGVGGLAAELVDHVRRLAPVRVDQAALDAFCFHWNMWAKRYKGFSPEKISFDLVNEPSMREDMNDQHSKRSSVPGDVYRKVAKAASEAIRKENKNHLVIADGNDVGNKVIPELIDLNIAQSCRGYNPGIISHYKAPWANKDPDNLPEPKWPGQVGDKYLSRTMLEEYYKPWIELTKKGVGVHCGECGCWNKTPHNVFLAWFNDLLSILHENQIGFALWEFSGSFGVLNSGREDITYEDWHGQKLDRKLLELLKKY